MSVLFNYALNTFYLRLFGVGHMVKDYSDSERGNPLLPHGLLFPISSNSSLYASSHRQDNTYHSLCYTSRGALAGTRNSSIMPTMKDRSDDPSHHERTLLPRSYISLTFQKGPILVIIVVTGAQNECFDNYFTYTSKLKV